MSVEIDNNVSGYKSLLEIEIGLREYIIDSFNKAYGSAKWIDDSNGPLSIFTQSTNKSGEKVTFYQKVLDSRIYSVNTGWNIEQSKEIHGLYFLLFTDLKFIIESKKFRNNKGEKIDVFQLNDRQIKAIISGMEAIFPIRNKLAHSVFISTKELKVLQNYHDTVSSMINNFNFFIEKSIKRENGIKYIKTLMPQMIRAIHKNEDIMEHFDHLQNTMNLLDIELEGDYISALKMIEEYSRLKNTKGSSVQIRNLIEDNGDLFNTFIK